MSFQSIFSFLFVRRLQSFRSLPQKPLSVDLTVEEGQRLKVVYGSLSGFHAIDVDSGTPYDLYLPTHVRIFAACLSVHVQGFPLFDFKPLRKQRGRSKHGEKRTSRPFSTDGRMTSFTMNQHQQRQNWFLPFFSFYTLAELTISSTVNPKSEGKISSLMG